MVKTLSKFLQRHPALRAALWEVGGTRSVRIGDITTTKQHNPRRKCAKCSFIGTSKQLRRHMPRHCHRCDFIAMPEKLRRHKARHCRRRRCKFTGTSEELREHFRRTHAGPARTDVTSPSPRAVMAQASINDLINKWTGNCLG
jgi:hypothetical protein